jgi:2-oxoglutarate dehydrogenase E2 component (dihydrolipoamide succinyltransferase)
MAADVEAVLIPKDNVNDEFVRLAAWRAKDGERVEKGAVLAEIETSKATIEIAAPRAGYVRRAAAEGASLLVGAVLCHLTDSAETSAPPAAPAPAAAAPTVDDARFSKKALELLRRHALDPSAFAGQGLVREADVLAALGGAHAPQAAGKSGARLKGLNVTRRELPPGKRAEIRSLAGGQNAGLSSLVSIACPRAKFREALARRPELSATPLAWIVSRAARLLRAHPFLNGYYEQGAFFGYDAVHVGFVVDAGRGLKVPVVRDADRLEPADVARRMQDLLMDYEEETLTAEALSNATFTITDLSAEDVVSFHPLINERQSAILGVAAARPAADENGGTFELALNFDHRATEGRAAARFLRELRDRLVAPPQ